MVKFRWGRHRNNKKDNGANDSVRKHLDSTSALDAHSVTTASVAETIDDDFTGKEIVCQQQQQQQQHDGRWDYLQNKRAMSLQERWGDQHLQKVKEMWDLSQEEQSKLMALKLRIEDIDYWKNDPYEAIRFLKEVRGSVKKAEDLFRVDYKWRTENNVDNVLETYKISPILNYFPIATLKGLDYDGDPIHLERPGAADCWSFYQRLGPDDIYDMSIYMRELDTRGAWHQKYEEERGHPVKQFTIVLDLEGLNQNHMRPGLLPLLGRILEFSQRQYPSFAKRVIILRAPRIFRFVWAIAQNFVQDNIKKLIVFTNPKDYLDVLDKYMDRRVLPPCICKEGRGEGTLGFELVRFEGGKLPPADMSDAEMEALLHQLKALDQKPTRQLAGEQEAMPQSPRKDKAASSQQLQVTLTPIVTTPTKSRMEADEPSLVHVTTTPIAAGYLSPRRKQNGERPRARY